MKKGASIHVVGSGEAFDSELGNTSYLFSAPNLPTILFDCGYQVPERLFARNIHAEIDAICFTHLHADHSFGYVPLLSRYWEEGRRKPLRVFAPKGAESYFRKLLDLGYPRMRSRFRFPVRFVELKPGKALLWEKLTFNSAKTLHSVLNLTIRVDLPDSSSFAVSGDGQITPATRELVHDVGWLLQEVYTLSPEVPVHCDLGTFAEFASKAAIRKIGIAHQSMGHRSEVHAAARALAERDSRWTLLKPGMTLRWER